MRRTRAQIAMVLLSLSGLIGCNAGVPPVPETPAERFTALFDGKTLDGWKAVGGDAAFRVEGGEIVGTCKNATKNTFLRTERVYNDFEFRCQFKWDVPGNSGVQYRSHQKPSTDRREPGRVYGYQFELDSSPRAWSGGFYEEGRRGWIVNLEGDDDQSAIKRNAVDLEGWNDIVIVCEGNRIRTWLNGVSIVNHRDEDGSYPLFEGFFALQVHAGGNGQFRWRDLKIREIQRKD